MAKPISLTVLFFLKGSSRGAQNNLDLYFFHNSWSPWTEILINQHARLVSWAQWRVYVEQMWSPCLIMKNLLWILFLGRVCMEKKSFETAKHNLTQQFCTLAQHAWKRISKIFTCQGAAAETPSQPCFPAWPHPGMAWHSGKIKGWVSACSWLFAVPPEFGVFEKTKIRVKLHP